MHYVYFLKNRAENKTYIGYTNDLKRRLKEHNAGNNFSTAPRRPFRLIYYEAYLLKQDAESREKYLKTSMGRRIIRKQLAHFLQSQTPKPKMGSERAKRTL